MKNLATLLVSLVASAVVSGQTAQGAALVQNWTGFYIGGHAGFGFSLDSDAGEASLTRIPGRSPPRTVTGPLNNDASVFPFGGAQLGYNFQNGPWVFGLQVDFSYVGRTENRGGAGTTLVEGPATFVVTSGSSLLDWYGTVNGRIGYAATLAMPYFTGGFAYGRAHGGVRGVLTGPGPVGTWEVEGGGSSTLTGWNAGAGAEFPVTQNLRLFTEYRYIALGGGGGGINDVLIDMTSPGPTGQRAVLNATGGGDANFHTIRFGFNYSFMTR